MSTTAHVFVIVVTLCTVGFIIWLVRQHRLKSKFSLLWLAIGLVLLVLAAFPNLLDRVSHAIGIEYPPATFLFAAVAFLFLVAVHYSWELSRLEERSRVLAEEAALLRESVQRLEDRLEAAGNGDAPHAERSEAQAPDGSATGSPEDPPG